ncbi:hypothetical protein C8J56DRAFT_1057301 [Mycena floridula]|nr:hypothetical protein C8J56DRAFT_1057301 [Mycena floridula]
MTRGIPARRTPPLSAATKTSKDRAICDDDWLVSLSCWGGKGGDGEKESWEEEFGVHYSKREGSFQEISREKILVRGSNDLLPKFLENQHRTGIDEELDGLKPPRGRILQLSSATRLATLDVLKQRKFALAVHPEGRKDGRDGLDTEEDGSRGFEDDLDEDGLTGFEDDLDGEEDGLTSSEDLDVSTSLPLIEEDALVVE